jgi:hypothetical protein
MQLPASASAGLGEQFGIGQLIYSLSDGCYAPSPIPHLRLFSEVRDGKGWAVDGGTW